MSRSLAIVLAAGALAGAVIVGPSTAPSPALVTGGLVARDLRRRARRSRTRLPRAPLAAAAAQPLRGVVAALAVGVILATVLAAAELMFVSNHDALMVSAIVLAAGARRAAGRAGRLRRRGRRGRVDPRRAARGRRGRARAARAAPSAARELAELADAANSMIEQLAEEERRRDAADSARRDLVAAISHDLRTPMTVAAADGRRDRGRPRRRATRCARYLARDAHARRRARLDDRRPVRALAARGRRPRVVDRAGRARRAGRRDASPRCSVEAEAKGVAVAAEPPTRPRPARADPEKLQRVLFNLIRTRSTTRRPTAASPCAPSRPASGSRSRSPTPARASRAPSASGSSTRSCAARRSRSRGGAGLGLAISRAIVEAHGGRIWLADSEVGTRVRFVIPT